MIFTLVRQIYIKTLDVTVVVKDMIMPKLESEIHVMKKLGRIDSIGKIKTSTYNQDSTVTRTTHFVGHIAKAKMQIRI